MSGLSPDLAAKVLDAERRNHVKNVGEGGTLNGPARQIFLDITQAGATPEELHQRRFGSLLRKWLDGGRLSKDERDEISHLLPDATSITIEATPLPQKNGALTEDQTCALYGISRAKFYRWKQLGAAVPDNPDPPPFERPPEMVSWYERMKARGLFKHKCPDKLHQLARSGRPAALTAAAENHSPPPMAAASSGAAATQPPQRTGFRVEFEEMEIHCAQLRADYTAAYESGETARADTLRAQYQELFAELRKSSGTRDAIKLAEERVKREAEADMALIVPSTFANLTSLASTIHREAGCKMPLLEFEDYFAARIRQALASLVGSKFAPPLLLTAA